MSGATRCCRCCVHTCKASLRQATPITVNHIHCQDPTPPVRNTAVRYSVLGTLYIFTPQIIIANIQHRFIEIILMPIMLRMPGFFASVVCLCLLLVPVSLVAASAASASDGSSYAAWEDASWAIWDVKLSPLLGSEKQKLYDDHIARCREAAGSTDRADAHCYVDEYVSAIYHPWE